MHGDALGDVPWRAEFVAITVASRRGVRSSGSSPERRSERRRHAGEVMSPARYEVRRDDQLVLVVTDEPGALVSRMSPPPPAETDVVTHPFLRATAYLPDAEGELRRLLDEAGSTAEYLDGLRAAGYTVARVE
jgi:hypothetical protein